MDRAYESGAISTPPAPPSPPLLGYPTESGTPTVPGQWWFHMLTEEIRAAIVAGGITPSTTTLNQLAAAIVALSSNASNLTTGTLNAARLPGTIASNTTGNAATATNATNATNAVNATNATNATNAVNANSATTAGFATTANNAATAGSATVASTVTMTATSANTAYDIALCNSGQVLASSNLNYNPASGVLNTGGPIIGTTLQASTSDEKLKENFRPIPTPLDVLDGVEGVIFDWRDRKDGDPFRTSVGFRAQQFQQLVPELVFESTDREGNPSHLVLNYPGATAVLWEAVRAMRAELKEARAEIAALRGNR